MAEITLYTRQPGQDTIVRTQCEVNFNDTAKDVTVQAGLSGAALGSADCGGIEYNLKKADGVGHISVETTGGIPVGDVTTSNNHLLLAREGSDQRHGKCYDETCVIDFYTPYRKTELTKRVEKQERTVTPVDRNFPDGHVAEASLLGFKAYGTEQTDLAKGLNGETISHQNNAYQGGGLEFRFGFHPFSLLNEPKARSVLRPMYLGGDFSHSWNKVGQNYVGLLGGEGKLKVLQTGVELGLELSYQWIKQLAEGRWDKEMGPHSFDVLLRGSWALNYYRMAAENVARGDNFTPSSFTNSGVNYQNWRLMLGASYIHEKNPLANIGVQVGGGQDFLPGMNIGVVGAAIVWLIPNSLTRKVDEEVIRTTEEFVTPDKIDFKFEDAAKNPPRYVEVKPITRGVYTADATLTFITNEFNLKKSALKDFARERSDGATKIRPQDGSNLGLEVNEEVYRAANMVEDYLKDRPFLASDEKRFLIPIDAFADQQGDANANLALSVSRAEQFKREVEAELKRRGITGYSFEYVSKGNGERYPLGYVCKTAKCSVKDIKGPLTQFDIGTSEIEPQASFFTASKRPIGSYRAMHGEGYGRVRVQIPVDPNKPDGKKKTVNILVDLAATRRVRASIAPANDKVEPATEISANKANVAGLTMYNIPVTAREGFRNAHPLNDTDLANFKGVVKKYGVGAGNAVVVFVNLSGKTERTADTIAGITGWLEDKAMGQTDLPVKVYVTSDPRITEDTIHMYVGDPKRVKIDDKRLRTALTK